MFTLAVASLRLIEPLLSSRAASVHELNVLRLLPRHTHRGHGTVAVAEATPMQGPSVSPFPCDPEVVLAELLHFDFAVS